MGESAGDMGRTDGIESESTRVGDVGGMSSSAGEAGRLDWFSLLSLNEVNNCEMVSDLRRDIEGEAGLEMGESWNECRGGRVAPWRRCRLWSSIWD